MTTPATKADAQQRVDDIRTFRRELDRLQRDGVVALSDPQHAAIRAHHEGLLDGFASAFDVDRTERAKQLSLGMRIASFLGALASAAAVFYLFLQFWGGLSTPLQVALLVTAPLAMLFAIDAIHRRDPSGYFTRLAALVAFACFVLDVAMLGSIFNITPSDKALLPWAAFALLLAYGCELRLLLVAGILCLAAFIAARAGTFGGMYWLYFGERPENFLPAALLAFCWPQLIGQQRHPGFAATYRVCGLLILLLPMLVLANWGHGSYLRWTADAIEGLYQTLGFVCSAGAIWLGVRRGWNEVVNTGVVLFVVFLYTKFFDWWWDWMPKYVFFFVLALTAVLLLLVFQRLRRHAAPVPAGAGQ